MDTEKSKWNNLKYGSPFFNYLKKFIFDLESWEKVHIIIGTIALISSAATNLSYPRLIGSIIDSTTSSNDTIQEGFDGIFGISKVFKDTDSTLKRLLFTAVPLYMIGSISSYTRVYNFQKAKYLIQKRYRIKMYRTLMLQGIPFFYNNSTGSLINNLKDCESAPRMIIDCFIQFLRASNSLIGGSFNIFLLTAKLSGVTLITISLFTATAIVYSKLLNKLKTVERGLINDVFGFVGETFTGINTVKFFGMDEYEINRFTNMLNSIDITSDNIASADGGFMAITLAGINLCMFVIMYLGSQQMKQGHITAGNLASFALYGGLIGLGASQMSVVLGDLSKSLVLLRSVYELIELPIETSSGIAIKDIRGKIEFRDISFSYPPNDLMLFNNLNLTISPGEVVAIVGESGSGKTSLLFLFSTLFKPNTGSIYLDDVNIDTMDSNWYRRFVFGIVSQEPILFSGSIYENICYGYENASMDEVYEAASKSNIHDFIISLPDKYQTLIGKNGIMLSTGQKQRIAIARAIIRNPPILILDEATSALDAGSESIVQAAIERAMEGRTVLMVTHRESCMKRVDRVLVMDKGEIVVSGRLNEVRQSEVYKKIFNLINT